MRAVECANDHINPMDISGMQDKSGKQCLLHHGLVREAIKLCHIYLPVAIKTSYPGVLMSGYVSVYYLTNIQYHNKMVQIRGELRCRLNLKFKHTPRDNFSIKDHPVYEEKSMLAMWCWWDISYSILHNYRVATSLLKE